MSTEFDPLPTVEVQQPQGGILGILQSAVAGRASIDTIERVAALYERMEARNAAADFNAAMAAFAGECPSIPKTSKADLGTFVISFASLDQIATTIRPFMLKHGLSYTFDSSTKDGILSAVCTVRHVGGHSQTATFACPTVAASKGMNKQQEVASALTYAKRHALIQALGLTTCETDNAAATRAPISAEDAAWLDAEITRVGADRSKFLAFMGVTDTREIPVSGLDRAKKALAAKAVAK